MGELGRILETVLLSDLRSTGLIVRILQYRHRIRTPDICSTPATAFFPWVMGFRNSWILLDCVINRMIVSGHAHLREVSLALQPMPMQHGALQRLLEKLRLSRIQCP